MPRRTRKTWVRRAAAEELLKLTKSQLKQLIKEELQEQLNGGAGDQYADLIDRLEDMYELWQPHTPEGIQYKDDLEDLILNR